MLKIVFKCGSKSSADVILTVVNISAYNCNNDKSAYTLMSFSLFKKKNEHLF